MYVIGVLSLVLIDTAWCVFRLVLEGTSENVVGHVKCGRFRCDVPRETVSAGMETGRIEEGKMVKSVALSIHTHTHTHTHSIIYLLHCDKLRSFHSTIT